MRELKFRVWDKQINQYRSPNTVSVMSSGKPFIISKIGKKNPKIEVLEDIIIEQYTGLRDKNGKDIYEGDIVYLLDHNTNVHVFIQNIGVYAYGYSLDYKRGKIIGNINENPELL